MVKDFEFFLKKGDVKRQNPDKNLSNATLKESLDRLQLAKNLVGKEKPKYILENAYDAMREAADSILYIEGFKSFSHEASISFLSNKNFDETDIIELNRFRKLRNGIKYYGGDCEKVDAELAIKLAEKIIHRIKKLLKDVSEG